MPELPEVEAFAQIIRPRIVGQRLEAFHVYRPLVLRNLIAGIDPEQALAGRQVTALERRGKLLLLGLEGGRWLAIYFMLTGVLEPRPPSAKPRKRDYYALDFPDGLTLVYNDQRGMGKSYLTDDLSRVPDLDGMAPDALDPALTCQDFAARLRAHRGEIKGVLTRERVVAGIGNAYADEILFEARLYPFVKSARLTQSQKEQLYAAMRRVLAERVTDLLTQPLGRLMRHPREGLRVHGRAGESCPRCGQAISEINVARRPTHFCRNCQPGLLIES